MQIKVIAGDIASGDWYLERDELRHTYGSVINLALSIKSITIQTETDVKRLLGTFGWALAGGLTFGLIGLGTGLLLGGRGKEITALIELETQQKFLAVMKADTYTKVLGLTFQASKAEAHA